MDLCRAVVGLGGSVMSLRGAEVSVLRPVECFFGVPCSHTDVVVVDRQAVSEILTPMGEVVGVQTCVLSGSFRHFSTLDRRRRRFDEKFVFWKICR